MNNEYSAEALACELVVDGKQQSILTSCPLEQGTSFSVEGTLPGSYVVYVIEMVGNVFASLLYDSDEPLSGHVSIPGVGHSLTTGVRGYVRVVAAPRPVPAEVWPVLLSALFCVEGSDGNWSVNPPGPLSGGTWNELVPLRLPDCCQGPPSPGNSDTM